MFSAGRVVYEAFWRVFPGRKNTGGSTVLFLSDYVRRREAY